MFFFRREVELIERELQLLLSNNQPPVPQHRSGKLRKSKLKQLLKSDISAPKGLFLIRIF